MTPEGKSLPMSRYERSSRQKATRCTVEMPGGDFCDAPEAPGVPFPICGPHARELYRYMQGLVAEVKDNYLDHRDVHHAMVQGVADQRHAAANSRWHRVYYLRVGDMIKIGTTRNLQRRMAAYPPGSVLLAVEPGGEDVEAIRHRQFGHLLMERNEWFRPAPDLMAHIAEVGLPDNLKRS